MDKSKHAFWQEILSEYSRSSQTVVNFCSDFGIPVWKFYYWRKRLSATKPVFEELSVKPSPASGSGIELSVGSLRIIVASDFDESTLRRVLSVLSC